MPATIVENPFVKREKIPDAKVINIKSIEFDVDIPKYIFSKASLRK